MVEINGRSKITTKNRAKDIGQAMLYTMGLSLLPLGFFIALEKSDFFYDKKDIETIIKTIIISSCIFMIILQEVARTNARKELVLHGKSKSLDLNSTMFNYAISRKKDFRREADFVEIHLRAATFNENGLLSPTCNHNLLLTSEKFEQYTNLCRLSDNTIPELTFQCDLLLDDNLLINLFRLHFMNGKYWNRKLKNCLNSNKEEPHSFLSIVRTAEEIARVLNLPLRMVFKDSEFKGKKSGIYLDL